MQIVLLLLLLCLLRCLMEGCMLSSGRVQCQLCPWELLKLLPTTCLCGKIYINRLYAPSCSAVIF